MSEAQDDSNTGLIVVNNSIAIMVRASQVKKLFKNVDISNERKRFFFQAIWDQKSGTCPTVKCGVRRIRRQASKRNCDDEVELTYDHLCFRKAYGPSDRLYDANNVV